ncbi:hypothetical protein [Methylocystis heyeri]|uniref:Uncharacterized protein n=1 Tax=Methylocystis heyeri TaxID=391905 RepID=A0A6B8K9B1_9HYPH|nr:hypothetical protein [Methylocystis heyeri]QGM44864.1 hypothetical protein H2LOC_003705 [Methylocystis heyeri]
MITLPGVVGLLIAAWLTGVWFPFALVAVVLAAVSAAFSSLTVEVSPDELVWFFGPGLFRKSVPRSEISLVSPVTNKWWYGWGIHLTPHGWLYNVSGLEAVEIKLWTGRTLRIGSDETEKLVHALRSGWTQTRVGA